MAKLTSRERNRIPSSEFGEPGSRKYPMPDKAHARNAKARASEMEHRGKISMSEEKKIDAKADRKLGKGGAKSAGVIGQGIGHPHHSGMNRSGHKNVKNPGSHHEKLKHC